MLHADDFIKNLSLLAHDDEQEVRKNVCKAIVMLVEVSESYLSSPISILSLKYSGDDGQIGASDGFHH